ncbi:hypothetical protein Tco_0237909 [Tanacetum coccineum]
MPAVWGGLGVGGQGSTNAAFGWSVGLASLFTFATTLEQSTRVTYLENGNDLLDAVRSVDLMYALLHASLNWDSEAGAGLASLTGVLAFKDLETWIRNHVVLWQVAVVSVLCVQPEPSYKLLIRDVLHSFIPLVPWTNERPLENKELNAIIDAWFTLWRD